MTAYASAGDLANYLDPMSVPTNAAFHLRRAQIQVDDGLTGAVYAVDPETGLPSDPLCLAALRDASCAQAFFLAQVGDPSGANNRDGVTGYSVGSISVTKNSNNVSAGGWAALCSDAQSILSNAGIKPFVSEYLMGYW